MRLLIIYDIPNDRIRTRVADACLDYGLERIQFSAFAGPLGRAHQRELELKVRRLVGRAPARVRFIPLDERLWEQQRMIERVIERQAPERQAPERPDGLDGQGEEMDARADSEASARLRDQWNEGDEGDVGDETAVDEVFRGGQ